MNKQIFIFTVCISMSLYPTGRPLSVLPTTPISKATLKKVKSAPALITMGEIECNDVTHTLAMPIPTMVSYLPVCHSHSAPTELSSLKPCHINLDKLTRFSPIQPIPVPKLPQHISSRLTRILAHLAPSNK